MEIRARPKGLIFLSKNQLLDSVVDSSELNQYNILNTHEEL